MNRVVGFLAAAGFALGASGLAMAEDDVMAVAYTNTIAVTAEGMMGDGSTTKYFYNEDGTVKVLEGGKMFDGTWERTEQGHCTEVPDFSNPFQRKICGPIGADTAVGTTWEYSPVPGLNLKGEVVEGREGEAG